MVDNDLKILEMVGFQKTSIKFDGHEFPSSHVNMVWCLWMAKKAHDGDECAAELLDKFGIRVIDVNGNLYWPVG